MTGKKFKTHLIATFFQQNHSFGDQIMSNWSFLLICLVFEAQQKKKAYEF